MKFDESYQCLDCNINVTADDFDSIDDELNPSTPRCPDCQESHRINGSSCTLCDSPAMREVELGCLCESCFEDYADGYS